MYIEDIFYSYVPVLRELTVSALAIIGAAWTLGKGAVWFFRKVA